MVGGRCTKCTTYHDANILEWDNQKHKRTIPINDKTRNVGIITIPPDISEYIHVIVADEEEELADQDTKSMKSIQ